MSCPTVLYVLIPWVDSLEIGAYSQVCTGLVLGFIGSLILCSTAFAIHLLCLHCARCRQSLLCCLGCLRGCGVRGGSCTVLPGGSPGTQCQHCSHFLRDSSDTLCIWERWIPAQNRLQLKIAKQG